MIRNVQTRSNTGIAGLLPAWLRILVMVVAIAAVLGVATGSASPAHFHLKAPAGGCDICFAAHVAAFEAKSLAVSLQAPHVVERITTCSAISGYQLYLSKSSLTRGPPQSHCGVISRQL